MSTSIPNINLNECALFDKTNYIEPTGNDQLLAIYNQLSAHGSELVAEFNACAEKLSQLMEKYPGHTGSDGKSTGKLVGPIETAKKIRKAITKDALRIGLYGQTGQGKSCTLNRLLSDRITCVRDLSNPDFSTLPIATRGGEPTSSCPVILAKKNPNGNLRIKLNRMTKDELISKAIAAVKHINDKSNNIEKLPLNTISDCKEALKKWEESSERGPSVKSQYTGLQSRLVYLYQFAESIFNGNYDEYLNGPNEISSGKLQDMARYAEHGEKDCVGVKEIIAETIQRDDYPSILHVVDIPGANANKVDEACFNIVEPSLDALIFIRMCTGGNFEDANLTSYLGRKRLEWQTPTNRYIFIYNAARSLPAGHHNAATPGGSLFWARDTVNQDLNKLFFFDAHDFANDEGRFCLNNFKSPSDITGIEAFLPRMRELNNNGGLYFLRKYLFVEWPLIVIDEIKTSIKNQIKSLHDVIDNTARELNLLLSLRTPLIQDQLSKALFELSTLKNKISCDFGALKGAVRELKNKINLRMDHKTRKAYTDPLKTTNEEFLRNVALCCQFFVEIDIYPFLLQGLIQKPIEELSSGITTECRWSVDATASKPLAELIRSKRPVDSAGENRFNSELKMHPNDPSNINLKYYKEAINSEFFKELEDKTALNEMRDDAFTMLTPLINASDLETTERRGDLFDLAKGACVNLATDLGSVVQAYWFVKVNDIHKDLRDLTANVKKI